VVFLFGGAGFSGATLAIMIMGYYPIHQTYGQLTGSILLAAGKTKLYRNIGILFLILGLPLSYFLIAPSNAFGLNYGSVGLAIKMILMQLIAVNVLLYFSAKLINISFSRYFIHQVFCVGFFSTIAIGVNHLFARLVPNVSPLLAFLLSGILYTAISITGVYAFPDIAGIKRQDIHEGFGQVQKRLRLLR
jgi:hypothetical protein